MDSHLQNDQQKVTKLNMSIITLTEYTIHKRQPLGRGVSGSVFPGVNLRTGSPVAAKISRAFEESADAYNAVEGEHDLLQLIDGASHIIQRRDAFVLTAPKTTRFALILDFVPSTNTPQAPTQSLSHLLDSEDPLPWYQIISCGKQLLECLLELKKRQIIHADLKPLNMVFNPDSNLLTLLDFANSTTLQDLQNNNNLTTDAYRSPEMFLERIDADFGPDMWSFGVTFFEICTRGRLPFYPDPLASIFVNLGIPSDSYLSSCRSTDQVLLRDFAANSWKDTLTREVPPPGAPDNYQEQVIDFLDKIFQYENRLTVEEALSHPLFQGDLQIHLNCEGIPKPVRKRLFLSTNGLVIPLTASCIHLPRTQDKYFMQIVDTAVKCLRTFETYLKQGETLFLSDDGFAVSKEDGNRHQPPEENSNGEPPGDLQEGAHRNRLEQEESQRDKRLGSPVREDIDDRFCSEFSIELQGDVKHFSNHSEEGKVDRFQKDVRTRENGESGKRNTKNHRNAEENGDQKMTPPQTESPHHEKAPQELERQTE